MQRFIDAWKQMEETASLSPQISSTMLIAYLLVGGVLALFVRFLFRKYSATASSTDSISRVFPLLTIITTAVAAVLHDSLTMSLGLVGALSIIRFRAALKEPEELIYLFLCITIGLGLGAGKPVLAFALVAVATLFVIGMDTFAKQRRDQNLLLTVSGKSDADLLTTIEQVAGGCVLQRYDIEDGYGQIRVLLPTSQSERSQEIMSQLRQKLPDCEMSWVNLNSTI